MRPDCSFVECSTYTHKTGNNFLKNYAKYEHASTWLWYDISKNNFLKTVDMELYHGTNIIQRNSDTFCITLEGVPVFSSDIYILRGNWPRPLPE